MMLMLKAGRWKKSGSCDGNGERERHAFMMALWACMMGV